MKQEISKEELTIRFPKSDKPFIIMMIKRFSNWEIVRKDMEDTMPKETREAIKEARKLSKQDSGVLYQSGEEAMTDILREYEEDRKD